MYIKPSKPTKEFQTLLNYVYLNMNLVDVQFHDRLSIEQYKGSIVDCTVEVWDKIPQVIIQGKRKVYRTETPLC